MKKFIIVAGMSALSVSAGFAQAFQKGTPVLNIGLGFGGHVVYWGPGYSSTPYINAAFDYGVFDFPEVKNLSVGIGGYLGFKSVSYTWDGWWRDKYGRIHYDEPVKQTWTYFNIGLRPTIHYSFNDKAELYGGLALEYVSVGYKYSNPDFYTSGSYGSYVGWAGFIGGRYYFSNSFGLFTELGYGMSYFNIGVSFKFK